MRERERERERVTDDLANWLIIRAQFTAMVILGRRSVNPIKLKVYSTVYYTRHYYGEKRRS